MVVFLAGLQGVPQSYYDAALVDGASPWQRFRHVTLPLLRPVVLFVLVTGIISGFQVFTLVYLMTEGGPLHSTDVLVYRIYQTAWEFLRFGYASAMAIVTRCRMPPDSSCGYCLMRRLGSGMPTDSRRARACSCASSFGTRRW